MQRIATVLRQSKTSLEQEKKIMEYLYTYAAFAAKDKKTRVAWKKNSLKNFIVHFQMTELQRMFTMN